MQQLEWLRRRCWAKQCSGAVCVRAPGSCWAQAVWRAVFGAAVSLWQSGEHEQFCQWLSIGSTHRALFCPLCMGVSAVESGGRVGWFMNSNKHTWHAYGCRFAFFLPVQCGIGRDLPARTVRAWAYLERRMPMCTSKLPMWCSTWRMGNAHVGAWVSQASIEACKIGCR
jgi:hypothetical protein